MTTNPDDPDRSRPQQGQKQRNHRNTYSIHSAFGQDCPGCPGCRRGLPGAGDHGICCAIAASDLPRIIWDSPDGRTAVITGAAGAYAGSQLFIREAAGALRQIPWPGFIKIPDLGNIIEPDVAW
jgi:hypothetical protein